MSNEPFPSAAATADGVLQCGRFRLPLARSRPLVMGILNLTPDSFSDGGRYHALDRALTHAEQMIAAGVDIIDIGGESTRPGSAAATLEEELQRVLPAVHALRACGKPLSVDTCKPLVMREALAAGADMINDIRGFRTPGALEAVVDSDCGLCIMHMQGEPRTMQAAPFYQDVVAEVAEFLEQRCRELEAAGIDGARICIDPGFGFGKDLTHNIALMKNIGAIQAKLAKPLLAGMSRKSMLGAITGQPVENRLAASLAAAMIAASQGVAILRVHDVAETVDALKIWQATGS